MRFPSLSYLPGIRKDQLEPPPGASAHMRQVIETLNASPRSFKERQTLKFLEVAGAEIRSRRATGRVPVRGALEHTLGQGYFIPAGVEGLGFKPAARRIAS